MPENQHTSITLFVSFYETDQQRRFRCSISILV